MAGKKQSAENWLYKVVLAIIPCLLNVGCYFKYVIKQEANRALKNLTLLIVLCSFAGMLLASAWLCLLALIFTYLISLKLSEIMALFILLLITLIMFSLICLLIIKTKNKIASLFDRIC